MQVPDVAIIGGGIVGLATGYQLLQRSPGMRVVILEKEARLASHQTGRNSGVVHSGIYYLPGSLKAVTCRRGKLLLEAFCRRHEVPFDRCGKVIVAVDEDELPRLARIAGRAAANGVECTEIGPERLHELEPFAAGVRALHVPETGIVDYVDFCGKLAREIGSLGGEIVTGAKVVRIQRRVEGVSLETARGAVTAGLVVNCAGLQSDRMLLLTGAHRPARIVPFRGEYYDLTPEARGLVRNLIYPVPDPGFPFLGVHFTRRVGGGVECGPNAVLALAREGYSWRNVNLLDCFDALSYGGFWRIARKHWRAGAAEVWRSLSKGAFTRALQRLVPAIRSEYLAPAEAGVRAQALGPDGALIDDFLIDEGPRMIHVLNAPSPAATASLAIGEQIVERIVAQL